MGRTPGIPIAGAIAAVPDRLHRQTRPGWMEGYAVRRELPGGAHDLICLRWQESRAIRCGRRDREHWRRGSWRPFAYSVVRISRRDFELHFERHDCPAPDSPTASQAKAEVRG